MQPKSHPVTIARAFENALGLLQTGNIEVAAAHFEHVLQAQPNHSDALHYLGICHFQRGNYESARNLIVKAMRFDPRSPFAANNLGSVLMALKRYEEALASYDEAIALKPDYDEAHFNRANLLAALRRFEDALASYDKAILLRPHYAEAWSNKGNALVELKRFEDALASYDKVLLLRPGHAQIFSNRAKAFVELGRLEEALESCETAIKLNPNLADAHYNRGNALAALKRFDDALSGYEAATELKPDFAAAHFNEGVCRLLTGDFEAGWPKFEWRNRTDDQRVAMSGISQPIWLGKEDIRNKTILLLTEQGAGDVLQFCRYAGLVARLGAKIILAVPKPVKSLLTTLAGPASVVGTGDKLPNFDCYCPLLSLPLAFRTTLSTIPADIPYLKADAALVRTWQGRLGEKAERLRVGLAWSGNIAHQNDRHRSIPLSRLKPFLQATGAELISLQKDVRDHDAAVLAADDDIRHFTSELGDFSDTAALISLMDIVISVDTAVAHLAGALGKPVWIMLPHVPDWRWLLDRDDSPWYPTARLFRQPRPGDWDSVMQNVCDALLQVRR